MADDYSQRLAKLEVSVEALKEQHSRQHGDVKGITDALNGLRSEVTVMTFKVSQLSALPSQVAASTQAEMIHKAVAEERKEAKAMLGENLMRIVTVTSVVTGIIFAGLQLFIGV